MSRQAKSFIKAALGIITNDQNQILAALRPLHSPQGGLWEFPGGKFEPNETAFQALKRELQEEIGIIVLKAAPFSCVEHHYATGVVELHAFEITEYSGTPQGCEGQEIRWVSYREILKLAFPAGNQSIINKLAKNFGQPNFILL